MHGALKTTEEEEEKAAVTSQAAREISVDASVAAVLAELDGSFALNEEKKEGH